MKKCKVEKVENDIVYFTDEENKRYSRCLFEIVNDDCSGQL